MVEIGRAAIVISWAVKIFTKRREPGCNVPALFVMPFKVSEDGKLSEAR